MGQSLEGLVRPGNPSNGDLFGYRTPALISGDLARRQVLLLRHGQGEHQLGNDVVDPMLTELGRAQAMPWAEHMGQFRPDLVLVSPLRRAVETACLAFQKESIPFLLERRAREGWWLHNENEFGKLEDLEALLEKYGRQRSDSNRKATQGIDEALNGHDPASERDSVADLYDILAKREENTIVVVCHWGVIHALCKKSASNCELVLCNFDEKPGRLKVLKTFTPPGSLKHAYVEVIENSKSDGYYYKVGDKGFCIEDETGQDRVKVCFDNGYTHEPPRHRLRTLFALGQRVRTLRDSCDHGKYYKLGEVGSFIGFGSKGRAKVAFDGGNIQHPSRPSDTLETIVDEERFIAETETGAGCFGR